MLTPIKEYPDYKKYAEELEKARADFVEAEIKFGKLNAIAKNLEITLGVDKSGSKINWAKIQEADQNSKIAKRELDLASENFEKVEETLKNTIEKIRKLKLQDAQKIGLRISRTIVKAIKMLIKSREEYVLLNKEMRVHFGEIVNKDGYKEEGFSSVIGPDCRFMIDKPLSYKGFLKVQKEYQKKVKDI